MKSVLKKYYEMNDEVKKDLELLYVYQILLSLYGEYEGVRIKNIEELERLLEIIQKCMITTDFSVDYIITNILEVLDVKNVSIRDLYDLEIDDLHEILFSDDEEFDEDYCEDEETSDFEENQEIIAEFIYKDYYCIFCQNKDKYLVILNKGENTNVIVLNGIDEMFNGTLERKLSELNLDE